MERKIDLLLNEYQESHQNSTNKYIHWICIPAIFFSLYGLLSCIPVPYFYAIHPQLNLANLLILLSLVYYLTLSISLFLGFLTLTFIVIGGNYWLLSFGWWFLLSVSIGIFVLSWIGQFIGHAIEGKKPSFLKDLQFLLIGPAWLMVFILKKLGINY